MAYASRPIAERFWEKVVIAGPGDCWLWQASIHPDGYGQFARSKGNIIGAHRMAYELEFGPIPAGLVVHHACFTRSCVNPAHLGLLTIGENVKAGPSGFAYERSRQTHCIHGHEFTPENTYVWPARGTRSCKTCHRLRQQEVKRARGQAS